MLKLIKFEFKKIIAKRSFKFIIFFIILVTFLSVYLNNKKDFENPMMYYDKVYELKKESEFNSSKEFNIYKKKYNKLQTLIKENNEIYNYSLNSDTNYYNKDKSIVLFSYTLLMFLMVVIVIIAGQSISSEYNDKTIKLLVSKPYKRYKILLAKFIALFIVSTLLCFLLSFFIILFVVLFNGISNLLINDLDYKNNKVIEIPFFINYYKTYCILLIPVLFTMLISFSLSTIFLNSSYSVSISLFISILGMSLFSFLVNLGFGFVEYTFLPYLDFTIFNDKINIMNYNIENNVNLNIYKGTLIIFLTSILLYFYANRKFVTKDIRC